MAGSVSELSAPMLAAASGRVATLGAGTGKADEGGGRSGGVRGAHGGDGSARGAGEPGVLPLPWTVPAAALAMRGLALGLAKGLPAAVVAALSASASPRATKTLPLSMAVCAGWLGNMTGSSRRL